MSTLVWVIISVFSTVLIGGLAVILSRSRGTPYVKLEPEKLPEMREACAMLAGLTESTVHEGNAAEILQNGSIFPAMLRDIEAAECCIHLETFVWSKGDLETKFIDTLSAKARAGIKVRVLIDSIGAGKADQRELKRLKDSGASLSSYCKPRWWNWHRFNHRTHRKVLIVDGRVAYTFGHGIDDRWLGDGDTPENWRDTGVRLEGPVVHSFQSVFAQNWVEETKTLPIGPGCFPKLEPKGDIPAHVVSSASGDAVSSVAMLYTVAIATARKEVLIQNPYFAPNEGVVELFAMMVKRGVPVHLMVPGPHTDSPFVRRAGCYLYGPMLEAGVRLYEFNSTLLHQKIVVVDELWSHVGSTNFDARSLALNEEIGVGILDAGIAKSLKKAFHDDLTAARELKLEEWRKRSLKDRLFDRFAYSVHEQL